MPDAIADMALDNYVTMRDRVDDPKFKFKKELGFDLELKFPNQFIPQYSMVMFHRIPYAVAYHRGKIQTVDPRSVDRGESISRRS